MWDIKKELNSFRPKRIGLLGGTFDPVHLGHLMMAQDALESRELDEVCFIPSAAPPHKTAAAITPSRHRVAMLESALESDLRFSMSLIELDRGGVSYTLDTVLEFRRQLPEAELFFIIGSDTLFELYSWKDIDKLIQICTFLSIARPNFAFGAIDVERLKVGAQQVEALKQGLVAGHEVDVSSTEVRMRVAEGLSIRYLVPDSVGMYIAEHSLYSAFA